MYSDGPPLLVLLPLEVLHTDEIKKPDVKRKRKRYTKEKKNSHSLLWKTNRRLKKNPYGPVLSQVGGQSDAAVNKQPQAIQVTC